MKKKIVKSQIEITFNNIREAIKVLEEARQTIKPVIEIYQKKVNILKRTEVQESYGICYLQREKLIQKQNELEFFEESVTTLNQAITLLVNKVHTKNH